MSNDNKVKMKSKCYVVLTTFPKKKNPVDIAEILVQEKLAACVQIVPHMVSVYLWQGKVNRDEEYLLLIKSIETTLSTLMARLEELHPYEVPEIMAIKASKISKKYYGWLSQLVT